MIILYFIVLFLALYQCRFKRNGFYDDYIDKKQCNAIKGIFIMCVFISHVVPYLLQEDNPSSHWYDLTFSFINGNLGQLIVSSFLFYSGYGVFESIKNKGDEYVKGFPRKRILNTLLNFDVAVLAFAFMDILLNIKFTTSQFLLSFIAWDSIYNSNWYIFCILICYVFTYIVVYIFGKGKKAMWYLLGLSFLYVLLLSLCKPIHWYSTILTYWGGCAFSFHKEKIDMFLKKRYYLSFSLLIILLIILHLFPEKSCFGIIYNCKSIVFAVVIVMITMKVKISNRPLIWLGIHLFPIYIYQRIPMILLKKLELFSIIDYKYTYIAICAIITILIAELYRIIEIRIK